MEVHTKYFQQQISGVSQMSHSEFSQFNCILGCLLYAVKWIHWLVLFLHENSVLISFRYSCNPFVY